MTSDDFPSSITNEQTGEVYNKYIIILGLLMGSQVETMELNVYFNDMEATKCFILLNEKIGRLAQSNSSCSMSLVCRNKDGAIIRYGFTNIVRICHNIPDIRYEDDDEI